MSDLRFKIGDTAWYASWGTRGDYVVCPDCGGTGRLRVTFHDETTASIACQNCALGYDPPTGRIQVYVRTPKAEQVYINGMDIGPHETRWRLGHSENCYRVVPDSEVFEGEAECIAYAAQKCAEADAPERQKILTKEKDARSWAWNASYHRKQIKDAEQKIVYHKAKLAVAAIQSKRIH